MTAPSIDAVSRLLRERADASFRADGKPHHFQYTAQDAELDRRAADALDALAKEPPHAEAARSEIAARRQLEAQTRELSHDSATATLEAQVADLTAQLHAQARELEEAREMYAREGRKALVAQEQLSEAQSRIAALEDAVRVKDEALRGAKRELWAGARGQWNLADFKNWAVVQQIDTALSNGEPR